MLVQKRHLTQAEFIVLEDRIRSSSFDDLVFSSKDREAEFRAQVNHFMVFNSLCSYHSKAHPEFDKATFLVRF